MQKWFKMFFFFFWMIGCFGGFFFEAKSATEEGKSGKTEVENLGLSFDLVVDLFFSLFFDQNLFLELCFG